MQDSLESLESRARRTGETLTIKVSGNATTLHWGRGRGRRGERLSSGLDALGTLLPLFEQRIPPEADRG